MVKKLSNRLSFSTLIDITLIIIVSMLPLIWLWGGNSILGHDSGTPLDPANHFIDRLHTWTFRYGLGENQTFAIPGFFVHGLEYLLTYLPLSLTYQQAISYIVYFLLMGFSAYVLARDLFPKKRYIPIFASTFYQVNHFVLQAWFIAERTKFTTYIALPLLLLVQHHFLFHKKKPYLAALITAFIIWVFNGGGFIPLFGSIFITVPTFLIYLIFSSEDKKSNIRNLLKYLIAAFFLSLGIHGYWLVPYFSYLSSSFTSEMAKTGGVEGVIYWVNSISANTSLINEFRLQGIQEWYVNAYHTYAHYYLNNVLLIIVSFLLPIAAFGSMLIEKSKKEKQIVLIFAFIALVSMVFMAGSHAPFGDLYIAMIKTIPGFAAFRTPFYKFAPGLWLSYGLLIGFTVDYLLNKIKVPSILSKIIIIFAITSYCFPILGKDFFTYFKDRSTLVKIPSYVHEYAKWSNSKEFNFRRLLILPPLDPKTNAHETDWGYWSLASLHSLLDKNSYVDRDLSYLPNEIKQINSLYTAFENGDSSWKDIALSLNIDGIILYEDVLPYKTGKVITPDYYKNLILLNKDITKEKEFGKWKVFRISKENRPFKFASSYYYYSDNRTNIATPIFDLPIDMTDSVLIDTDPTAIRDIKKGEITTANCIHCTLIDVPYPRGSTDIIILPGSKFFEVKLQKEAEMRKKIKDLAIRTNFELETSWNRLNEIERLIISDADTFKKALGWKYFADQQKNILDLITTIHKTQFTKNKNDLLVLAYDTVKLQNSMVRERVKDISGNVDEGFQYLASLKSSNDNLSELKKDVHYTSDLSSKKMVINLSSSGLYDIFVENTLQKPFKEATSSASLKIMDKIYPLLRFSEKWLVVKDLNLRKGKYAFSVEIPDEQQEVLSLPKAALSFNELENCKSLDLENLKPGTYKISADVESPTDYSVSLFITERDFDKPLLPYWGDVINLKSKTKYPLGKIFSVDYEQKYKTFFCVYDYAVSKEIQLSSLKLHKIANPDVAFIIENNIKNKNNQIRNVDMKISSQTNYEMNISPGSSKILIMDQRFNNLWSADYPNSIHLKTNLYSNGWYIPKTDKEFNMKIKFKPEEELHIGRNITLITFILMTSWCIIYLFKKYDK